MTLEGWHKSQRYTEEGREKDGGRINPPLHVEPSGGFGRHIGAKVNLENGGRDDEVEDVGCGC